MFFKNLKCSRRENISGKWWELGITFHLGSRFIFQQRLCDLRVVCPIFSIAVVGLKSPSRLGGYTNYRTTKN